MNKRLIFVDDEEDIVEIYQDLFNVRMTSDFNKKYQQDEVYDEKELWRLDYEVTFARSGEEAIAIIKRGLDEGRPIAGGFFDIRLGDGINGIETVNRIKAIDSNILCCMITGNPDFELTEFNDLLGDSFFDFDYLEKPFSEKEIIYKAYRMIHAWNARQKIKTNLSYCLDSLKDEFHLRFAQIGELASTVTYEINDPIENMVEDVGRMKKMLEAPHLAQEDIHELQRLMDKNVDVLKHVGQIVNSYLQLAHMHEIEEITNFSVNQLLEECRRILRYRFKTFNVELRWPERKVDSFVYAQKINVLHVLLNLLSNALQAVRNRIGQTWVELQVEEKDSVVEFRVLDNGDGISPDLISRIFEPRFSTKISEGNSGMGLSISKEVVLKNQGELFLDQNTQNTCFVMRLPISTN